MVCDPLFVLQGIPGLPYLLPGEIKPTIRALSRANFVFGATKSAPNRPIEIGLLRCIVEPCTDGRDPAASSPLRHRLAGRGSSPSPDLEGVHT